MATISKAPPARRIRAVNRRLVKHYGAPEVKPRLPILDELIVTVLSQHTSDVNTARAFSDLKARWPKWHQVVDAPVTEIAAAIRSGGLAQQKAPRIKAILDEIARREGAVTLERLDGLDDSEVVAYLRSLPGVGPKTAACVLVFAMGRAAFPIDTHVHRVARRLGWIADDTTADKAHRMLEPVVPSEIRYELHMALIRHGRTICKSRRPHCRDCVLFDLCEAGPRLLRKGEAAP